MPYSLSPELDQLIQEKISSGQYGSEEEVLQAALHALRNVELNSKRLRDDIRGRVEKARQGDAVTLDRDAFKQEARNRRADDHLPPA